MFYRGCWAFVCAVCVRLFLSVRCACSNRREICARTHTHAHTQKIMPDENDFRRHNSMSRVDWLDDSTDLLWIIKPIDSSHVLYLYTARRMIFFSENYFLAKSTSREIFFSKSFFSGKLLLGKASSSKASSRKSFDFSLSLLLLVRKSCFASYVRWGWLGGVGMGVDMLWPISNLGIE